MFTLTPGREPGLGSPVPWPLPPPRLRPARDEVHVWRVVLDHRPSCVEALLLFLAGDERARADRFRFERDRGRFVVGRATLRQLLGRYLGRAPEALSFRYGERGKPDLAWEAEASPPLRFNVSHSHGLALHAVTLDRHLGVDLERIETRFQEDIAERFFSRHEVATLRALPVEQQTAAFFTCWTRKEAYVKAKGDGLSFALDRFAVSLDEPATLLHTQDDPREAARWRLATLRPGSDFAAALAVAGSDWRLECWEWATSCGCAL